MNFGLAVVLKSFITFSADFELLSGSIRLAISMSSDSIKVLNWEFAPAQLLEEWLSIAWFKCPLLCSNPNSDSKISNSDSILASSISFGSNFLIFLPSTTKPSLLSAFASSGTLIN